MSYHLTVVQPFGSYNRGDHITDPEQIAKVLSGGNAHSVVKRHPHPEHSTGVFYMTNQQLRDRAEAVFKKPDDKAK